MKAYQFAILRYVHDVFAGEQVNIGVVMWIPDRQLLQFQVTHRYSRLKSMFSNFDGSSYREAVRQLTARFHDVSKLVWSDERGSLFSSRIKDIGEILKLLLPEESCCFRWSDVRGGIAQNPSVRFRRLFTDLVGRHLPDSAREKRENDDIWATVERSGRAWPPPAGASQCRGPVSEL